MVKRSDLLATGNDAEHLAGPMPFREVVPEHEVSATLMQDADQIPKILGLCLNRCGGAQQHMVRPCSNLAHEGQQLVRRTRVGAKPLTRARLVRLVQDHQTEAQPEQLLLLGRVPHHQAGRDDADAKRAARHVLAACR